MVRFLACLFITMLIQSIDVSGQRLEYYGKEYGKTTLEGGAIHRIRFDEIVSYFDFIEDNDVRYFYHHPKGEVTLYFWLDNKVNELAIRAISPIPKLVSPRTGNKVTDLYTKNEKNKENGFDTEIVVERAANINSRSDISILSDTSSWVFVDANGFSSSDINNHTIPCSEVRLVQYDSESDFQINAGLYKISVTAHAGKKMHGSLLVEIGCTDFLSQPKVSSNPLDFISH